MAQGKIKEDNTRVMIVLPKEIKAKADIIANSDVDPYLVGFAIL